LAADVQQAALRDEFGRHHVSVQTLDAADFGVPQTRRRLFVICDRLRPPPELTRSPWLPTPDAASILDAPGAWSVRPLFSPGRAAATLVRAQCGIAALGEGVPFLIVYYGSDGAGGWQRLDRPLRTLTTLDRFGLVEWHGPEPTLRMLQVPELRRAMSFPDTFRLERGTRRDRIKLLGNAVCPPVMQAIVAGLVADRASTAPVTAAA
jgi:DNA (cytosine-5)-methyltransferase 1